MDPDADSSRIMAQLLVLVILTLINAFFAGAEMAVVSVNKNKIKRLAEDGNKNASLIQNLMQDSTKFLSTIQVAITLSGFFSSASAATGISKVLGQALENKGIPFSQNIAMVTVTIMLSYFTLVFGELVPKRIALQKAEEFAIWSVRPIYYISKILSPFIKLLSLSTHFILRIIGMKKDNLEEQVSEEEIKALLETGSETGVFNEIEAEMINSIFSFDDKIAKEIMVPRKEIDAIDLSEPKEQYMQELLQSRHSRVPVYDEDIDHIIGIVNLKDIVRMARGLTFDGIDLKEIMHPPYFVHTTKNTDELFQKMKADRQHIAVLIDEYGGTAGIVTMEDLLEEIVGDIWDEYDEIEQEEIKETEKGVYEVQGGTSLEDVNEELHLTLVSDNYDTVSGFVIEQLDYIPKETDHPVIQTEQAEITVEEVKENRILRLKFSLREKETSQDEK